MKASVIIPNLNGAGWLRDSIESIRAQTEPDFELIVVDNGSTDESLAIARSYQGQPGYTLIENRENTGFSHAVNQGIRASTGEYAVLFNNDAFAEPDGCGGVLDEFSGKVLVQQEPDASSFPNGGIRNTFEARGYSAWDPTSPAFIVGGTLCIPTVFIAYTGEALDYKVPLLRSISAVNKAATEVCRYFDKEVNRVIQYLGWEQEYFLVDESLWAVRSWGMNRPRTSSWKITMSGRPPRGSSLSWPISNTNA